MVSMHSSKTHVMDLMAFNITAYVQNKDTSIKHSTQTTKKT